MSAGIRELGITAGRGAVSADFPGTERDRALDAQVRRKSGAWWVPAVVRWLETLEPAELGAVAARETPPADGIALVGAADQMPPGWFASARLEERLWAQGLVLRAWPAVCARFGAEPAWSWLRLTAEAALEARR